MKNEKWLIDANELLLSEVKRCGSIPTIGTGYSNEMSFLTILEQAPTVDAVEVVHGRWVKNETESEKHVESIYFCSVCQNHDAWGETEKTNYCPNCGAKMDGE